MTQSEQTNQVHTVRGTLEGNPYVAEIHGELSDGYMASGYIRVEPPFSATEEFLEQISENADVDLTPYVSTPTGTLLKYNCPTYTDTDEKMIVGEVAEEVKDRVYETMRNLVDALGFVASRDLFASNPSRHGGLYISKGRK